MRCCSRQLGPAPQSRPNGLRPPPFESGALCAPVETRVLPSFRLVRRRDCCPRMAFCACAASRSLFVCSFPSPRSCFRQGGGAWRRRRPLGAVPPVPSPCDDDDDDDDDDARPSGAPLPLPRATTPTSPFLSVLHVPAVSPPVLPQQTPPCHALRGAAAAVPADSGGGRSADGVSRCGAMRRLATGLPAPPPLILSRHCNSLATFFTVSLRRVFVCGLSSVFFMGRLSPLSGHQHRRHVRRVGAWLRTARAGAAPGGLPQHDGLRWHRWVVCV
jgi:hypothetical protein